MLRPPIAHSSGQITVPITRKRCCATSLLRSPCHLILLGSTERAKHGKARFIDQRPVHFSIDILGTIDMRITRARPKICDLETVRQTHTSSEREFNYGPVVGVDRSR